MIILMPTQSSFPIPIKPRFDKDMSMIRELGPEYLGVAEAEAITGVSRWTWRRWAYDGKISSVKLGKRLLIPSREIARLVAENMRPRLSEDL